RMKARIELGIPPYRLELRRADAVRVRGFFEVDRALYRRHSACPFVGFPLAGPDDVVDLLEALTVLRPALDDLDAVEIARGGVFARPYDEARRHSLAAFWHRTQIGAHRNAACIRLLHPVSSVQQIPAVAPAAEETHFDVRATHAKGFLAVHRVPDRRSGVLL